MERAIPRYLWVYNSLQSPDRGRGLQGRRLPAARAGAAEDLPGQPDHGAQGRGDARPAGLCLHPAGQGHPDPRLQGHPEARVRHLVLRDAAGAGVHGHTGRYPGRFRVRAAADRRGSPGGARNARSLRIDRVTLANGTPIALMTNYLLPELVPGHREADQRDELPVLVPRVRVQPRHRGGHGLHLRAARPRPGRRRSSQIPEGSPLLVVRRITHSGGRPIEVAILLIVADKYEYCVHTKDRPPRRCDPPTCADRPRSNSRERRDETDRTRRRAADRHQRGPGAPRRGGDPRPRAQRQGVPLHRRARPALLGHVPEGAARRQRRTSWSARRSAFPSGRTAPRSRWPRRGCSCRTACRKWT